MSSAVLESRPVVGSSSSRRLGGRKEGRERGGGERVRVSEWGTFGENRGTRRRGGKQAQGVL